MKNITKNIELPSAFSRLLNTITLAVALFALTQAQAQSKYILTVEGTTASWQNPQNWDNNRLPASGASVEIRLGTQAPAVVNIQDIPANTQLASLSLQVANSATVVLEAATQGQVILGGAQSKNALHIPAQAHVILAGSQSSWQVSRGSTAIIEGTLTFANGTNARQSLVGNAAGAIVFKKGSVCNIGTQAAQGYQGIAFGTSHTGAVVFESGSRLVQFSGAAIATQPQAIVFEAGSTFEYAATNSNNTPSLSGFSFANLFFNTPVAATATLTAPFSVKNITVAQGALHLQAIATITTPVAGNITLQGGQAALTLSAQDGNTLTLQLNGTEAQTISGTGEVLVGNGAQLIVAHGAVVDLRTQIQVQEQSSDNNAFGLVEVQDGGRLNLIGEYYIYGNGRFTLAADGTLGIGSKNGIYLERNQVGPRVLETELGNVRTGTLQTRVFAPTAHYIYIGAEAQETGTGLPVNSAWRGTTLPRPRLTIATQSNDVEVRLTRSARTSIFTLEKGLFSTYKEGIIPALRIMGYQGATSPEPGLVIAKGGNLKPEASVLEFQGPVQVQATGTLNFFDVHLMNTATWAANGGAITDFGATGNPVIEGILYVNKGTIVAGNGPAYSSKSAEGGSIIYQATEPYLRGAEWAPAGERGYPNNVWIRHRTVLLAAGNQGTMQQKGLSARGTVRVFASAAFSLQHDAVAMQLPLVIGGNLLAEGAFTGSVRAKGNVVIGADGAVNIAAGGNELVAHDILIDGALNAAANSQINIAGSWVRNASTGRYTAATSVVTFTGSENARLAVTNATDVPAENFYSLRLQKQNLATTLRLEAPVVVSQQLSLTTGTLATDAANLLTLANAQAEALVMNANTRSTMVSGPMQRITAAGGTYVFPVGKWSEGIAHIRHMQLTEVSAADAFTAEYFAAATPGRTATGFAGFEAKLNAIKENEYWNVARAGTVATAAVVLPYERHVARTWVSAAGATTAPQNKEGVEVWAVKEAGIGQWNFAAAADAQNAGRAYEDYGMVATAMQQSFGTYTIGYSVYRASNISIQPFTAVLKGADALLSWKVEDPQQQVRSIAVEYSTDGNNFSSLATVQLSSFVHKALTPGAHHYRLAVVDANGRKLYSKVEIVTVDLNRTLITGLVQNPVTGGQAVVRSFSKVNQQATAVLIDMNGRVVMSSPISLVSGENRSLVPMAHVAAGTYRLLLRTQDGIEKAMPLVLLY